MIKYYSTGSTRVAMRSGTASPKWILGDHLGSTHVVAKANGTKDKRQLYGPWGNIRYDEGDLLTGYGFTGQYDNTDDFGLMFYNARWYDPALGRFSQADTIVPGAMPIDFDRYAYVRNSPTGAVDPSGHRTCTAEQAKTGDETCDQNIYNTYNPIELLISRTCATMDCHADNVSWVNVDFR